MSQSQQLELLTENPGQWTSVALVTPEIQKKEIKPFVVLALKEIEGNPDSRISSLANVEKFSAVREIVRHVARNRSATKEPWLPEDVTIFLESLRLTPECVTELTSLLCTDQIYQNVPSHIRVKPGLVSLQWRIDVSLSQSNKEAENATEQQVKDIMYRDTHIILIFKLTDGRTHPYRTRIKHKSVLERGRKEMPLFELHKETLSLQVQWESLLE